MVATDLDTSRISVRGLWKIFGPDAARIVDEERVQQNSKGEILERTGHVIAIKDISFDVSVGEVFVVMGLSGSGKSTLVRCLIRLVDPTEGSIFIDGEDIVIYDAKQLIQLRRKKMGMIFQHYGLLPHRTVLENVGYGLEVQGIKKAERSTMAMEQLKRVGLESWAGAYPDELSGGMQQRVGIGRALVLDPEILLMDEPFSGLDPLIRREMQDELIALQGQLKKTIVFITHDLNEALKLGDRIAIMRDGEIIQLGTPEEIVTHPADAYVGEFVRDVSKAKVLGAASIMQEAESVVYEWQGPQEAVHVMESNNADHVFVLGHNRELVGDLSLHDATEALERGATTMLGAMDTDCPRVAPATLVEELAPLSAQYDSPIAVVDEQGCLQGEVHRSAVLSSMAVSTVAAPGDDGGVAGPAATKK